MSCSLTNYSALCENLCITPATCSATTGRCECPTSAYTLIYNGTKQTCNCPNYPFNYFDGSDCVSASNGTMFALNYVPDPDSDRRFIIIPSDSTDLDERVIRIFLKN